MQHQLPDCQTAQATAFDTSVTVHLSQVQHALLQVKEHTPPFASAARANQSFLPAEHSRHAAGCTPFRRPYQCTLVRGRIARPLRPSRHDDVGEIAAWRRVSPGGCRLWCLCVAAVPKCWVRLFPTVPIFYILLVVLFKLCWLARLFLVEHSGLFLSGSQTLSSCIQFIRDGFYCGESR